ncbi:MAG TPA: ABC transporter substrate-binding protein [Candidatus Wunengus sp. YC65]|uniref:ABC transporter substrate-binding protein n=1 Tax=Candidatus Wunengus sp. YC65 TaxID=3367701 RepID=UPI0040294655
MIIFIVWLGFIYSVYASDIVISQSKTYNTNEDKSVLNVYTWVDFIDPEIFLDFEKEFHVKVHIDYYDDEELMFSTIQSGSGRYDVVFPSDSLTDVMLKSGLLSKLNIRRIPNIRYLRDKFRVITKRKWMGCSVPIDWGVTGIAYNTKYVTESVDSWDTFWRTKYKDKMALLNNSYDVITVGQKRLGYSLNPANPSDIIESMKVLKVLKPLLQEEGFMSYSKIIEKLKSEELWIAQCYNGDAALVNEENDAIKFVIPKEGTGFWTDNIAVPIGAKQKQLAENFINFMLRPEISARHTNYCYYANCNKKAGLIVKKEILRNPYVYIDKKEIDRLGLYEILNPDVQKRFNECWAELVKY